VELEWKEKPIVSGCEIFEFGIAGTPRYRAIE
jgi:hypothetical protein